MPDFSDTNPQGARTSMYFDDWRVMKDVLYAVDGKNVGDVVSPISGGPAPGDANKDGVVDDADLSLLLAHWSQDRTGDPDGGWSKGEFDGTAPVQDNDLSLLLANWTAGGAVPEPASALLLLVGFAAAVWRRSGNQ